MFSNIPMWRTDIH